ncbi:MAG: hypothetical protein NTW12_01255 [Deltaproteobacteria bacterium]|nr:hypothetical protein [Deltaproteobacteria bacterium]
MIRYNLTEFFKLSAALNYQLSVSGDFGWNILRIIIGDMKLSREQHNILLDALSYLNHAYKDQHRRLGPMSVIHPLRATAILSRTVEKADMLDLLTVLLHDKHEDIQPSNYTEDKYGNNYYQQLENEFKQFLYKNDPNDNWYLMERLDLLSRHGEESYFTYIGRLMNRAQQTPELVRVKLADRLDNTLDLHSEFYDPIEHVDFFGALFNILYIKNYQPPEPEVQHPVRHPLYGAYRLYQLFKNAVLLSLVRQKRSMTYDPAAQPLFEQLVRAGMEEAQRIIIHIFNYHMRDVEQQRKLILDTMNYCKAGGTLEVTRSGDRSRLDGLFMNYFEYSSAEEHKQKLDQLYKDKPLMIQAALAFVTIFKNFLIDPQYCIEGICEDGFHPRDGV